VGIRGNVDETLTFSRHFHTWKMILPEWAEYGWGKVDLSKVWKVGEKGFFLSLFIRV
jgi:hypothetical protein